MIAPPFMAGDRDKKQDQSRQGRKNPSSGNPQEEDVAIRRLTLYGQQRRDRQSERPRMDGRPRATDCPRPALFIGAPKAIDALFTTLGRQLRGAMRTARGFQWDVQ